VKDGYVIATERRWGDRTKTELSAWLAAQEMPTTQVLTIN